MTSTETLIAPPLALVVERDEAGRISRMHLEWSGEREPVPATTPENLDLLAALTRYVSGGEPGWPAPDLDAADLSPFSRAVLAALAEVPAGTTVTYGELAARAGNPAAARAVGRCMAANPWPLVYPCHRVVGATGLTGFGGGLDMKRWLLELEGGL